MTTSTIKKDSTHNSPMRHIVSINGRDIVFDVPPMFGGEDSAPTPHDYIDAALVACKTITIRMFAAQKKLPLEEVKVTLNSDASEERKGRYVMNLAIELIGDLSEEDRQFLLSVAEQCPTGKMLSGDINVEINAQLV